MTLSPLLVHICDLDFGVAEVNEDNYRGRPTMTIELGSGQDAPLVGRGGDTPSSVQIAIGWDVPTSPGRTLRNLASGLRHFYRHGDIMTEDDLGIYAFLFKGSEDDTPEVLAPKGGLYSKNGSIRIDHHSRKGRSSHDAVGTVSVDLLRVPSDVKHIVFTLGSLGNDDSSRYDFSRINNSFCRATDEATGDELAVFRLSSLGDHNLLVLAKLSKTDVEGWSMTAIGSKATGLSRREIGIASRDQL